MRPTRLKKFAEMGLPKKQDEKEDTKHGGTADEMRSDIERRKEVWKKSRAAKKGWLNIVVRQVNEVEDISSLSDAVVKLEKRFAELMEIQEQAAEFLSEDEILPDVETESQFHDGISKAIKAAKAKLTKIDDEANSSLEKTEERSGRSEAEACSTTAPAFSRIQRPKLKMPSFTGDKEKWTEFWELFEATIHDDSALSAVEKFQYLKSLLEGEAATVVRGIRLTGDNYATAVNRLKERYENDDAIEGDLLDRLFRIKEVKNPKDVRGLRAMVDEIIVCVRELENTGVPMEQYGKPLVRSLSRKIPSRWLDSWLEKGGGDLVKLCDFLEEEVKTKERKEDLLKQSEKVPSKKETSDDHGRRRVGTTEAWMSVSRSSVKPCLFCDEVGHEAVGCKKQLPVAERWKMVRAKKGCFRCARTGHRIDKCFYKERCACGRTHIPQLCEGVVSPQVVASSNVSSLNPTAPSFSTLQPSVSATYSHQQARSATTTEEDKMRVQLRTVRVVVGGIIGVRGLCDTGCSMSLVDKRVSEFAKLKILRKKRVTVQGITGRVLSGVFNIVQVPIVGVNTGAKVEVEAIEVPDLAGGIKPPPKKVIQEFMTYGGGGILADYGEPENIEIGLVLGEDVYEDIMLDVPRRVLPSGMKATSSIFGWLLHGRFYDEECQETETIAFAYRVSFDDFWELEHLGVKQEEGSEETYEKFLKDLTFEDGRYTAGLLWKEGMRDQLPGNLEVARKRLKSLLKRLSEEDRKKYDLGIQEYVEKGWAEEAPDLPDGKVSYLAHKGVKRESKTTAFRIVQDASAKANRDGLSLNDCLETGPSLLPELQGVFLRFRKQRVAVTGDLTKAFLQVALKKEDRDACRFLWQGPDGEEKVYRMARVLFGSTCSPFYCKLSSKTTSTKKKRSTRSQVRRLRSHFTLTI